MKYYSCLLFSLLIIGCEGTPMAGSFILERDRNPPILLDYRNSIEEGLVLIFDESAFLKEDSLLAYPPLSLNLVSTDFSQEVVIGFNESCTPGEAYKIHFDALDERGNQNWFIVEFFGPNPRLPGVLINELSPNGSSTRPDMIELYVTAGGNTAGMTLFLGLDEREYSSWTFSSMEWQTGEYILLHCRPEGLAEEISELGSELDLSGGLRAEPGIRDLWAPEDMNLSGTSAIISLMGSPAKGPLLDRIIYTNRIDNIQDQYGGWTSALWQQILSLAGKDLLLRGWQWEGEFPKPSDTIWSDDSTSTRTLCRNSLSFDSDSASDWHTVPTSGSTFGFMNNDDIYE